VTDRVEAAYAEYDYHAAVLEIHRFAAQDLSAFYLDVTKDILYCDAAESPRRRAAQAAMWHALCVLVTTLAPILPFTAEEAWAFVPGAAGRVAEHTFHHPPEPAWNEEESGKMAEILALREQVNQALEDGRRSGLIGSSLEAALEIKGADSSWEESFLRRIFLVSEVRCLPGDGPVVDVRPAPGAKCPRCWTRHTGSDELCGRCRDVVAECTD